VIEFVDTHAHLQEPEFADDADAVVERARTAGVTTLVLPAVDLETARSALALAHRHQGIYATAGYHPHEASSLDASSLRDIEALLADAKVVAVGEIGLDFYRMHSAIEAQTTAFDSMLRLAERHVMPVVIHCRDAWDALAEQLVPWARRVSPAFAGRSLGVLHYFSASLDEAQRYIGLGFLISVHTSVTHPKAAVLREVVVHLPLESLVIETDSPYGAPQAQRGKRNEPAFVVEAAKQLADLHGVPLDRVASITSANARRLFDLPVLAGTSGGNR
jgi:TatD DNase family protein